jgi:hypothetical protein
MLFRETNRSVTGLQGENEMLGLGLLGTIIVVVLIIWVIRRV